jgi:cytidylate kinase
MAASEIATFKDIRKMCVIAQQEMASNKGVVMDGRDTTSVVMPDAELKIFMIADSTIRAKRRVRQNMVLGFETNFETVLKKIKERDINDMSRKHDPLVIVKDAIQIDTTNLTLDEVSKQVLALAKNKA